MFRIAICEEKNEVVAALNEFLERYKTEKGVDLEARAFRKGEAFLAENQKFDCALIDVGSENENGVETALKLRELNARMPILFLTSSNRFTLKGYEVDAVDFLPLPASYYAFSTLLDRVQIRLVKMDVPYIAIMTKTGAKRVSVDAIEYMEGGLNHVVYHMKDGDERVRGSLTEEAKKVTEDRFFRLGNYLINLAHVSKVWESDVYVGRACLPISRKQKTALLTSLTAFMNRG